MGAEPGATTILVDADACPVRAEAERVAARHGLRLVLVSNGGIRPPRDPLVELVVVPRIDGAADDWIASRAGPGDVVVTADIPLAARALDAGAVALAPDGRRFDARNIGLALGLRELGRHLRESERRESRNPAFTPRDRSRFLEALEAAVREAAGAG